MEPYTTIPTQADTPAYQNGYHLGHHDGRHARIARDALAMLLAFVLTFAGGTAAGWIGHAIWQPVASQAGWGALIVVTLIVMIASARRPAAPPDRHTNDYGEVWHGDV